MIYKNKGLDGAAGCALGGLLGPIGIVIALVAKPNNDALEKQALQSGEMRKCPSCAELIRAEAAKCRYCGTELPASSALASVESNLAAAVEQAVRKHVARTGDPVFTAEALGRAELNGSDGAPVVDLVTLGFELGELRRRGVLELLNERGTYRLVG